MTATLLQNYEWAKVRLRDAVASGDVAGQQRAEMALAAVKADAADRGIADLVPALELLGGASLPTNMYEMLAAQRGSAESTGGDNGDTSTSRNPAADERANIRESASLLETNLDSASQARVSSGVPAATDGAENERATAEPGASVENAGVSSADVSHAVVSPRDGGVSAEAAARAGAQKSETAPAGTGLDHKRTSTHFKAVHGGHESVDAAFLETSATDRVVDHKLAGVLEKMVSSGKGAPLVRKKEEEEEEENESRRTCASLGCKTAEHHQRQSAMTRSRRF